MKKRHVEKVVLYARGLCQDNEFYIIGSQSLHGKYPDLADEILMSHEVDIIAKNKTQNTENLNVIGVDSEFHVQNGYYADPVEISTAVLPRSWKNRLVHLKLEDTSSPVRAYCLEPHDLTVAKLAAAREKDHIFIKALLERNLLNAEKVRKLIDETPVSINMKQKMLNAFNRLILASQESANVKPNEPDAHAVDVGRKSPATRIVEKLFKSPDLNKAGKKKEEPGK